MVNGKNLFVSVFILIACESHDESHESKQKRYEREQWEKPCSDEAVLLATTSGSPNSFRCSNQRHRMRVQVATASSNEEAAALIFCECVREIHDASD
jgi:hypothetical protein